MTNYAGETYLIEHVAEIDGVPMDDTDVDGVNITIFDSAGEEVVAETPMTWEPTDENWQYVWFTGGRADPIDPGTYKALCVIDGLGSSENWEVKKIRLARNTV